MTNRTTACVNGCTGTKENMLYVVRRLIGRIDQKSKVSRIWSCSPKVRQKLFVKKLFAEISPETFHKKMFAESSPEIFSKNNCSSKLRQKLF